MIKSDYSHSTSFSGSVTPFTKDRLLKISKNPETKTKLKNKFKEIETHTNKNSAIHLFRQSDDLFNFALIVKNDDFQSSSNYVLTKGFIGINNIVEGFLDIKIEFIKKMEKILMDLHW